MAFDPSTAQLAPGGFDPSTATPAKPAKDPLNPIERMIVNATQGPNAVLGTGGAIYTGIHSAVNDGTFGLADKAAAALYHALHNDVPYATALAAAKDNDSEARANHPVASVIGDVAGAVTGGGIAGDAVKVAGALPKVGKTVQTVARVLAPTEKVAGAPVASNLARIAGNVGKSSLEGAVTSGGVTALNGGDADQVAESAAAGAVLNPVLTKGASVLINKAQPLVNKSMNLLASKLDESPEVLQAAFDKFKQYTGTTPPLAAIVGLKSQGQLSELASANGTLGDLMAQGTAANAKTAASALPARVEAVTGAPPQSISDLTVARKQAMTQAMDPIRDQPVSLDQSHLDILQDPRVRAATRDDPELRASVTKAVQEIGDNGSTDALTVNDVDAIRQSLGSRQSAFANPNNAAHNSQTAQSYGAMRDKVTSLVDPASSAGQDYQAALDQFANDSHYIAGFKHGMAGKDVSAADTDKLITSLSTSHGKEGYQSGLATRLQNSAGDTLSGAQSTASALTEPGMQATLRQTFGARQAADLANAGEATAAGQKAMKAIAPSSIAPEAEGSGIQAGQAAGAALSHSPAGLVFHAARAMPEVFGKLSPKVQETIGRYLSDPKMAQQGINLLKKAGANKQDLRNLAAAIGTDLSTQAATATSGN